MCKSTFRWQSLTILVYLHSFSCCCVRNLQNPAKLFPPPSPFFTKLGMKLTPAKTRVVGLPYGENPNYNRF